MYVLCAGTHASMSMYMDMDMSMTQTRRTEGGSRTDRRRLGAVVAGPDPNVHRHRYRHTYVHVAGCEVDSLINAAWEHDGMVFKRWLALENVCVVSFMCLTIGIPNPTSQLLLT